MRLIDELIAWIDDNDVIPSNEALARSFQHGYRRVAVLGLILKHPNIATVPPSLLRAFGLDFRSSTAKSAVDVAEESARENEEVLDGHHNAQQRMQRHKEWLREQERHRRERVINRDELRAMFDPNNGRRGCTTQLWFICFPQVLLPDDESYKREKLTMCR